MKTPDEWLRDFEDKIADARAKADAIGEGMAHASATASSPDGAVTVTVAPNGALTDVRLTAAAMTRQPAQLAAEITATARKAQRTAGERVAEAFGAAAGGAGAETYRLITQYLPPPEDDEPEERRYAPGAVEDPDEPAPPRRPAPPAPPRPVADEPDDDYGDESIYRR
ncbi:YbaB/EbfC family nucleoid-associated protein [Actinokineospora auranticolor]|uniref:YbaB/EbfC DNA-binding family protein n=1 Tax=Actinokineospora auranticolor TaxID=155976 RepID=A0A2S6GDA4_9PSEU|nr:YbaB/EbfC family nucleoid-associated protein [Actinokineospora auranticolor]PPK63225.1 YbaB/EbfC DNA-binding family protein [Actinokineospora auranticolor]